MPSNIKKVHLSFYAGSLQLACLFSTHNEPKHPVRYASFAELESFLAPQRIDPSKLKKHLLDGKNHSAAAQAEINLIKACNAVPKISKLFSDVTTSTRIVSQRQASAKWIPKRRKAISLTRAQTFACILMLDSLTCNLGPDAFADVFAISSGSSIYVAGQLFCDPHEQPGTTELRRVIGNIGRAGISLLMPPSKPKMREGDPDNWKQINHFP